MPSNIVSITWVIRENRFPQIIAGMEARAEAIVAKAAMDIEAHAKSRAPVDTGTLKNSIQAIRVGEAHWKVVVGADYGMYVEWGTVNQAAQPFLQPAIGVVTPQFIRAIRTVCQP